jgi:glycosyltransferase involved in cell wall biosynthesis
MSSNVPATTARPSDVRQSLADRIPIRVGVICDFLEEKWPSMDLVGDMLCRHLADNLSDGVAVTQLRPRLRQRLARVPFIHKKLACNVDRLINRFVDYPTWLSGDHGDHDLFHLVDHSYAHLLNSLPPKRTVVTCHDLDTFRCLLEPEREKRSRWFRAMSQRILDGFLQAAHVITVSATTRDELLRYDLFPRERTSVVPNGVHPSCSPLPDRSTDEAADRLFAEAGKGTLWLLNVGSTLPRKRLDVLLRVFSAVHRDLPAARLVRVGGGFTSAHFQLARDLEIDHALVLLPYLERGILAAVYRRAALLLHTADAEGFGLPIVEAMACGCPVVASDIPVLREVGGAAATYCRVADVDDWKDTVVRLLCQRIEGSSAWAFRCENAIAYASHFTWVENARQTARIYRQVLANN